jgi:inosose dehydratase
LAEASSFLDRLATAPISWGVCEVPGWGHQLSPVRVLDEMRSLGFTHTELGSAGWLPDTESELRAELARHDMKLLAAFIPLVLHDPGQADEALVQAERNAELLADLDARYFNTAPVTSLDWQPRFELSDREWDHLYAMVAEVETICQRHGLQQVVHEHVGCVIETADEVKGLLEATSASLVLDTGHLAIGGFDPVDVATHHADRVGLVHLKDTRLDVAERLNAGELTLMEAVQNDLVPALGQGDLKVGAVITALEQAGYAGWYVIEQDCALTGDLPGIGEGPIRDVESSVAILRELAGQLTTT